MRTLTESDRQLIRDSGLFDAAWYAEKYPDVAATGLDPIDHFMRIGVYMDRESGPLFDSKHYRRQLERISHNRNSESPLVDYLSQGWKEGLNPNPFFDVSFYLDNNPDVVTAGIEPLRHYILYGSEENRSIYPSIVSLQNDVCNQRDFSGNNFVPKLFGNEKCTISINWEKKKQNPKILLIVSFYQREDLADRLLKNLLELEDELLNLDVELFLINDSPDDTFLDSSLKNGLKKFTKISYQLVRNPINIGFIKSNNLGINYAIEGGKDVLFLNSDALLYPGTLSEIQDVAYSDELIAHVSPRSNNATICTFPIIEGMLWSNSVEYIKYFKSISKKLPRISYVPTVVGFCMFSKGRVLAEMGGFDEIYGLGYNEENDLVMRTNKFGYRAVIANHCAAWHDGESSFKTLKVSKEARDAHNSGILNERYPYYRDEIHKYFNSSEFISEKLISRINLFENNSIEIAFDLSNVGDYHNGTFEAAKQIILNADKYWSQKVKIIVYIQNQARIFHNLHNNGRLNFKNIEDMKIGPVAIIRIGQPFHINDLTRLFLNHPIVGIFMLDTIAWDCAYLKGSFNELIWKYVFKYTDLIFTNSEFTANQISKRFQLGLDNVIIPALHSTDVGEYIYQTSNKSSADKVNHILKIPIEFERFVLITGNKFHHKAMKSTIEILSYTNKKLNFIALGYSEDIENLSSNVWCVPTGALSDQEVSGLYKKCSCVVFPSHYEGFGFPILHALSYHKPIFVRKSKLFFEISEKTPERNNIIFFDTIAGLSSALKNPLPVWNENFKCVTPVRWKDTADLIYNGIMERMNAVRFDYLNEKIIKLVEGRFEK
jgi:GT2 family glycosyltransferase